MKFKITEKNTLKEIQYLRKYENQCELKQIDNLVIKASETYFGLRNNTQVNSLSLNENIWKGILKIKILTTGLFYKTFILKCIYQCISCM